MKRILFSLFTTVLFLAACSNEELIERSSYSPEAIFEKTGCHPTDVQTIKSYTLFKDTIHGLHYLYGSRLQNEKECFWVAQYDQSGNETWSYVNPAARQNSYADQPVLLANGNLLIADVRRDTLNKQQIRAKLPTIFSLQNGTMIPVAVSDTFAYTHVHTFADFFFCTLDPKEEKQLMTINPWSIEVRNSTGKIIAEAEKLYIPQPVAGSCEVTWTNDTTYIQQTPLLIERYQVRQGEIWSQEISLPDYQDCTMHAKEANNIVEATYLLTDKAGNQQTEMYHLYYDTGKFFIQTTGIAIAPTSQILYVDETYQLKATIEPANASNQEVVWSSSDKQIATVSATGLVTAVAPGTCQINVTTPDGRHQAGCVVTVKQKWVADITQYISLEFEYQNIQWNGNIVSGSIYSKLINKSDIATIQVTKFQIQDKFHNWNYQADASLLNKEVAPLSSYRLGSKNISNLYAPVFIWEYEYHGQKHTIQATFSNPNATTDPDSSTETKTPPVIIITE